MALRGPATVPQQPERGLQRQPPSPLPPTASLQRQAPGRRFASALLLMIMGQLSERFVVQHCSPSLPCGFE